MCKDIHHVKFYRLIVEMSDFISCFFLKKKLRNPLTDKDRKDVLLEVCLDTVKSQIQAFNRSMRGLLQTLLLT